MVRDRGQSKEAHTYTYANIHVRHIVVMWTFSDLFECDKGVHLHQVYTPIPSKRAFFMHTRMYNKAGVCVIYSAFASSNRADMMNPPCTSRAQSCQTWGHRPTFVLGPLQALLLAKQ